MRLVAGLAAGAVWLMAAMPAMGPAYAQQPVKTVDDLTDDQMDELYCVYDYLDMLGDRETMTTAYLAGDSEAAVYKEQMAEVDQTAADCNDDYMWTQGRKDTAAMIGFYGVVGDELEARLSAAGLKETDITALYDAVDALPDDDIGKFVDGDWVDDRDLEQRLTTALAGKGIKGQEVLTNAFYLAEAYIIVSLLTHEWLNTMPAS